MSAALSELVQRGLALEVWGDASVVVSGVRHDSRAIEAGDLFVAVPGRNVDGAAFAASALAKGAVAIATEAKLALDVPQLHVADARVALGALAGAVYGDPTRALRVIGVTGTNGKTTTTWIIDECLRALGSSPALLGTVESRGPGVREAAPYTTPEGDAIARFARQVVDAGATHLVMEVSSHALAQHRADAVCFEVAAFTNLTQDHLDFHGTMGAYFDAKARLFTELAPKASVINVDDPHGARLAEKASGRVLRVSQRAQAGLEALQEDRALAQARPSQGDVRARSASRGGEAPRRNRALAQARPSQGDARARSASRGGEAPRGDLTAFDVSTGRDGIRAGVRFDGRDAILSSPLIGAHNLENLLLALGCLLALDVSLDDAVEALSSARGAPGRLERVEGLADVMILVDYAHTPDALSRALAALRSITPGRLFVVFGCGGDRDRGKRPIMGEAAARGADLAIVTSDNPRTEDPFAILAAIEPGVIAGGMARVDSVHDSSRGYEVVEDRREAIRRAISAARPGDTVLIAGKGHEDYQIRGTKKLHFDDREEARAAIAVRGGGEA